jgi:hypothetical protein
MRGGVNYRVHKFKGEKDYAFFATKGPQTMFRGRIDPISVKKILMRVKNKKPVLLKIRG